jgi:hypothetical protein
MKKIIRLFLLISLLGCNNEKKNNELEKRLTELEAENQALKEAITAPDTDPIRIPSNTVDDNFAHPSKTFAFVLLVVEQQEENPKHLDSRMYDLYKFNLCSGIQELDYIDDNIKYKLMDEIQADYYNGKARFNRGKVLSRECLTFNSYKEASIEREKYLVLKQEE